MRNYTTISEKSIPKKRTTIVCKPSESLINSNNNISVYLKNRNVELAKRLFQIKECRPLISNIESEEKMIEFVSKHLFEREVFYNQATIKIDCHGNDINTICKEIISVLN